MPLLWAGRKGPASYTRYFALGMHLSPALQSPFSFQLGCGYDARKKKKIAGLNALGVSTTEAFLPTNNIFSLSCAVRL